MNGVITYQYIPKCWNQKEFLRLGGFSLILFNYNKKNYIENAVRSVFAQDFPLVEIFLMDDASTDGSGDMMEALGRSYHGRHKVIIVRNSENQHIVGQWNIVSKLATGNWFGMFCGDDWSYPDRVSNAARRIGQYSTLKGLCASGIEVGKREMKVGWSSDVIIEDGSSLEQMADGKYPVIGASVFWHRSLFEEKLPPAPLDDLLIRWRLQFLYREILSPIWMWDGTTNAIKYSFGAGITTAAYEEDNGHQRYIQRWIANTKSMKHFASLAVKTYKSIENWLQQKENSYEFIGYARYNRLKWEIKQGNTLNRIVKLPFVFWEVIRLRPNCYRAFNLLIFWIKYFIQEFFGLYIAAFLSCLLHARASLQCNNCHKNKRR